MSDLFWLTEVQMERLRPFVPKRRGRPRDDGRRVLSGIIFINRNGLRWRDGEDRAATGSALTKYSTTDDVGGAGWASSRGSLSNWSIGGGRDKHRHDRCEQANAMRSSEPTQVPQGAPHGLRPAGEKGGGGRAIGQTKRGKTPCPAGHFRRKCPERGQAARDL